MGENLMKLAVHKPQTVKAIDGTGGLPKIAASVGKCEPTSNTNTLDDFLAHMPDHRYIFIPTRDLWPASSVDSSIEWPVGADGNKMKPSRWLDANQSVEQQTWAPGLPLLIENK